MPNAALPDWVPDAVFYQIFPDRFAASDQVPKPLGLEPWDSPPTIHGYKGGDLLGVVEHLDWLTDLGATALYLNPIFQSAANHRYHPHDHFAVDPMLGGDAAFDRLLSECHDRGIRVVLDGVFNHASRGFWRFNDILENGESSPWVDWFTIHRFPPNAYDLDRPPDYDAWWGMHALPKLNTDNPEVREYLMQVAEHWVRRGVDGWRLDVPEEIATEGFWEEMRERVRSIDAEAYLVGEIWHPAPDWVGHRFDGVMNYPFTEAALRFVAAGRIDREVASEVSLSLEPSLDAPGYSAAIDELLGAYPNSARYGQLNLLGSHDTARVLSTVGNDADSVRLAAVLMFTFPGPPCVYYGDEIGMTGRRDPGCRGGFPWDDPARWDDRTLEAFRALGTLRHQEPALRRGDYQATHASGGLYAFTRATPDSTLMVVVNAGDAAATTPLDSPRADLLWGEGVIDGAISTPPRRAGIWRLHLDR